MYFNNAIPGYEVHFDMNDADDRAHAHELTESLVPNVLTAIDASAKRIALQTSSDLSQTAHQESCRNLLMHAVGVYLLQHSAGISPDDIKFPQRNVQNWIVNHTANAQPKREIAGN